MQRIAKNRKMFAMVRFDMWHVLEGNALRTTEPRRWGDVLILFPCAPTFKHQDGGSCDRPGDQGHRRDVGGSAGVGPDDSDRVSGGESPDGVLELGRRTHSSAADPRHGV